MRAQVLDDSTCKVTRQLVDEKAAEWAERGVKCEVVRRTNRQGYKAGALKDVSAAAPAARAAPCRCMAACFFIMQWGQLTIAAKMQPKAPCRRGCSRGSMPAAQKLSLICVSGAHPLQAHCCLAKAWCTPPCCGELG